MFSHKSLGMSVATHSCTTSLNFLQALLDERINNFANFLCCVPQDPCVLRVYVLEHATVIMLELIEYDSGLQRDAHVKRTTSMSLTSCSVKSPFGFALVFSGIPHYQNIQYLM